MNLVPFLVVEQGAPFEAGAIIPLYDSNTIIGRQGEQWKPHMSFNNAFISRKHISIYREHNQFFIMDLNSKHGTEVNDTRLPSYKPLALKESDKISLANGMAVFYFSANVDETMDLTPVIGEYLSSPSQEFHLNPVKQTLRIHDTCYTLSEKEYKCLELLLQNQQQFISQEEVKRHVWPERICLDEDIPNVGSEELASLIYRIRKRTNDTLTIESIRGKGYILHLKDKVWE